MTVHDVAAACVVMVTGELDYATVGRFRAGVNAVAARLGDTALVIDLSGVEFLGSGGLAALVDIHRTLANGRPARIVAGESRRALRPIQLSGLDQILSVHHSVDDALAANAKQLPPRKM